MEEFRAFSISDELTPLIFLNGVNAKPAQFFSLVPGFLSQFILRSAIHDGLPFNAA